MDSTFSGTVVLFVSGSTGLAVADMVSSDPYCVIDISKDQTLLASGQTKVIESNLNPNWKESFSFPFYQIAGPLVVNVSVWDKDNVSRDDFLGHIQFEIDPNSPLFGKDQKTKLLPRPNRKEPITTSGEISYKISYQPGVFLGENHFKCHDHKFTGLARAMSSREGARGYGTYQIQLFHIKQVFGDHWQGWNKNYEAAQKIFGSSLIKSTIATQHSHLYSDVSVKKKGVLRGGDDLLNLLKNGYKGGRRRFFTYAIKDDWWYFSETGAAFFVDFTSKHAMHACVSEEVRYAGEFHFHKKEDGKFMLVIDNNSGTYAPSKDLLPSLKKLMELNFNGLEVEVLDYHDEKLKKYKADMEKEPRLKK